MDGVKQKVREFLIRDLAIVEESEEIKDDTTLISSGLIDSITSMELVSFLEKEFGITVAPHEVDKDYLDSLDLIDDFVSSKLK